MSWYVFLVIAWLMVGKRFAQVELVTCVSLVMREWSVELKEGWNADRVWSALNESISVLTLQPQTDIPLIFKQRSK